MLYERSYQKQIIWFKLLCKLVDENNRLSLNRYVSIKDTWKTAKIPKIMKKPHFSVCDASQILGHKAQTSKGVLGSSHSIPLPLYNRHDSHPRICVCPLQVSLYFCSKFKLSFKVLKIMSIRAPTQSGLWYDLFVHQLVCCFVDSWRNSLCLTSWKF